MLPAGADGHGRKPLLEGLGRAQRVSATIGVLACAALKIACLKKFAGKLGFGEWAGDTVLGPSTKSEDVCNPSS